MRLEAALRESAAEVAASRKEATLMRQEAARCKKELAASQAQLHAARQQARAQEAERKQLQLALTAATARRPPPRRAMRARLRCWASARCGRAARRCEL